MNDQCTDGIGRSEIGTGKTQKTILGECPECGFAVRFGWENGKRVCVKGHTWHVASDSDRRADP